MKGKKKEEEVIKVEAAEEKYKQLQRNTNEDQLVTAL